jgi:hypothetical protein
VGLEWQHLTTTDPAIIVRWWRPGARWNLGVQLGPKSGLIDVECDSPEAERALGELLGESAPVVPTFFGKRGRHRLFRWTPDLPCPDKASFKFRGIEFRTGNAGKGCQSLFPPSAHPDGPVYRWLVHPDDGELVPFPARALAIVRKGLGKEAEGRPKARVLGDGEAIPAGARNSTLASLAGTMRRRGFGEAAIRAALLAENAERCEPPLGDDEVAEIARKIARYAPADVRPRRPAPKRCRRGTLTIAMTWGGGT